MQLKSYLLGISLGLSSCLYASAQENLTAVVNQISIEDTALKILVESPGFTSDLYSLKSLEANLKTSSNLPDPEIGGEYLFAPEKDDNRWAAEISWGLEWPGVYGARSRESNTRISAADKAVYAGRVEKLVEIKDLLLDYIQCRQKLDLLERLTQNNEKIYQIAQESAKGGELTLLDINKIKIEYANIKGARATLLEEKRVILESLTEISGKDCSELLKTLDCRFPDIFIPSDMDLESLKADAPSLQAAAAAADIVKQGKKVTKMEALPSLSIGYKHQYEEGMHFNGAMLGISIPIFSSRGKRKAIEAEIIEADYKLESTAMTAEAEVNTILKTLRVLKEQVDEITPLVESIDYNKTLLRAYEEGLITLLDYLTELNYFTNASLELVNLRHAAAKANNRLQKYMPISF